MKKLALVLVIAFYTCTAHAQVRLGFTAGPNYTKQVWKSNSYELGINASRFQYHFGAILDVPVAEDWSIVPELLFSAQGAKNTQESSSLINKTLRNLGYIKMPICLQYMIDRERIFWQFNAGPYISRLAVSNNRFDQNGVNVFSGPVIVGNTSAAEVTPWDYGMRVKAGFEIKRGIGMHFFYDYGLKDVNPQNTRAYNRVAGASLSYMFKLSPEDRYSRYQDYYNY